MTPAALAVFVVGLRHGADPDHLAAIDNLTRNATERTPYASRFVGTLFALGHSAMILALTALAGALGAGIAHASNGLEMGGSIASIVVLLAMAALNILMLTRGSQTTLRTRMIPQALRKASNPYAAIPLGALFGLGFETSSQLLAYGVAFSSGHLAEGLFVGSAFCLGMICTDTFDSLFVARVVALKTADAARARRAWIVAATLVALAVAAQEIVQLLGYASPIDEVTLSVGTVVFLIGTAIYVVLRNRVPAACPTSPRK
jgi:high-affinity nickel-transport protein